MAQPVWVLSVDLQTKTATFQSGMAEAARSARGAFTEIKSGSGEMAGAVGSSTGSARQAVMLLGDEFGIHLPRGLTTFLAGLGPIGPAMEAAFPFVAIALGATLLIEHLAKLHENGEKLTRDEIRFGTAAQNAFNSLDEKLLRSQIRADELRNDHLGALHKELQLINMQSMDDLVHTFSELAKEADVVFAGLKKSWYEFGSGSERAKKDLDEFQVKYAALLAKHDDAGATDLLRGTRESAARTLEMQKQAQATGGYGNAASGGGPLDHEAQIKLEEAIVELKKTGHKWDGSAIESQQKLVELLNDQVEVEQQASNIRKSDGDNAKTSTAKTIAAEQSALAKQAADAQLRIGEKAIAADRAMANARLEIQRASIQERLTNDVAFADREYTTQLAANGAQVLALNQLADDYHKQLKALQERAAELTQERATHVAEITAKSQIEQNAKDLAAMQEGERAKIDAAQEGSAARLSVIDAAIREEAAHNMQELSSYRELLIQRVNVARQMFEEEAKLQADAGREALDNAENMGQLGLAAEKQHQEMLDAAHHMSIQQRLQEEIQASNEEFVIKQIAMARGLAALDKSGKDYQNKLNEMQDKEKQLTQAHENELTAIKEKAEQDRNSRILSAEDHFNSEIARGLTQVLMGHKSFASMMNSIGNQVVSGMMENAIKSVMANDYTKESDAAAAARKAFLAGMHFPFPANIVMGPALGAMAFASVMAFEGGGVVPGSGRGDVVPAMLTPGEGIVKNAAMDKLNRGEMGGGNVTHIHVRPTYHLQALDGDGISKVLDNHSDKLQKHFETTLRKMNR